MIWGMMNYARFQDKIEVSKAISIIKDLTCLVGNSSKASMKNDMLDFNVIKFIGIKTRSGKVLLPLPIRWEFPSPGWVKINTDGAARGYPGLATCGGIFRGVWENLLVLFQRFLKFKLLWLLSFMELYMLWRKLKKWDLLMSGLNVILPWFVLRLLLRLMFRGCFRIDGILVLIFVGQSGLG